MRVTLAELTPAAVDESVSKKPPRVAQINLRRNNMPQAEVRESLTRAKFLPPWGALGESLERAGDRTQLLRSRQRGG